MATAEFSKFAGILSARLLPACLSVFPLPMQVTGFPVGSAGKESTCNAGDLGSIPGLGRSLGGRHGHPLQYSCLEDHREQRSLAGYSPWGCRELDTTEHSPPLEKASSSGLCLWVLFLPQKDVARMLWDIGRKGMDFPQGPVMCQRLQ